MTAAPTIIGQKVRLRPHVMTDMDAFWTFFQGKRSQHVSKPQNRTHLWYGFASEVGSWTLTGMGGWAIDVDGQLAGQVAITHPPHFPETELGCILFDGFEGRGVAFEAASLALDYARTQIRPASLVSYIDAGNARSIALAKRLGAVHDPAAATYDDADVVYRHKVRHAS